MLNQAIYSARRNLSHFSLQRLTRINESIRLGWLDYQIQFQRKNEALNPYLLRSQNRGGDQIG
jgi:hypothetical protein